MIALRSENQILKKYIKDIKLQKLNLSCQTNEQNEMSICQIDQMFDSFNNNLNNYYYSYSKLLRKDMNFYGRLCFSYLTVFLLFMKIFSNLIFFLNRSHFFKKKFLII
jgi:hypothetical protein